MKKYIIIGSIVKFKEFNAETKGYFKVWSIRGDKANLGVIFGKRHLYFKGIPLAELVECDGEWYSAWSKSETYQCM
jgi:hypothetical protein